MPFGKIGSGRDVMEGYSKIAALGGPPRLIPAAEQPIETKFEMVDGIASVLMQIRLAGTYVPQHSHEYSHISALVCGKIAVWKDDVFMGEFTSPHQLVIEAHAKHLFLALEDNTTILCIHNVSRSGEIEIAEEHKVL